jgi:hypothetical protein
VLCSVPCCYSIMDDGTWSAAGRWFAGCERVVGVRCVRAMTESMVLAKHIR